MTARVRTARRVVKLGAWLLLAGLLAQVYLAGLFLMGGADVRGAHEGLGYLLGYLPPLVIVGGALFARVPGRFWLVFGALFVALHVQPVLTHFSASEGLGWVRALHPLNAVVLIALTYALLRLVRRPA